MFDTLNTYFTNKQFLAKKHKLQRFLCKCHIYKHTTRFLSYNHSYGIISNVHFGGTSTEIICSLRNGNATARLPGLTSRSSNVTNSHVLLRSKNG